MAIARHSPPTYNVFYLITIAALALVAPSMLAPTSWVVIVPIAGFAPLLLPMAMICALIGRFYKRVRVKESVTWRVIYLTMVLNVATLILAFISQASLLPGMAQQAGFIAIVGLLAAGAYKFRPLKWLAYAGFTIISVFVLLTIVLGLAYIYHF